MKISSPAENRIIVDLNEQDMIELDITYDEMDYSTIETRRVIWTVLDAAGKVLGKTLDPSRRMVIEAVPRSEGGCTLFFTILEDSKNGFRQKSTLKKQVDSLICEFSDLDSLFSAVSRLEEGVCAVESSLYENGGSYRLIISSPFDSARLRRFFSEFCVVSSCEKLQCEYTKEHWQLIAPNNALSLLS
ncbi:MAG: adaptor protein MecA [Clostridia bacterium]|nr:adaptor protein MecA [Clostridia bacterium]